MALAWRKRVQQNLIEARNISKSFGGIQVLDDVCLGVQPGEVHALLGENGAGKSTLMNILSGVLTPDSGEILFEGRPVRYAGPRDAQRLGISFVHQELALVTQLSVAENVFLGRHPTTRGLVDLREMHQKARQVLRELGHHIDTRRPVGELNLAERQLVEIARAVAFDCRVIIMDEPTAPLSDHNTRILFRVIRLLKARGAGIIYISHRLSEIFEISDRVTVMRDGRHVLTRPASEVTHDDLVRAMIGAELRQRLEAAPVGSSSPDAALRIQGTIILTVHRGEIVGLAGLAGAGRTRLLEWLFGAAECRWGTANEVWVNGRRANLRTPVDAVRHGLALVPDDRKTKGLVPGASVLENMALASGRSAFFLRRSREAQAAQQWVRSMRIKISSLSQPVAHLSGGTQQKVVLAKWMLARARVFLMDEPTRGIDVGAKAEIYDMIRTLAAEGAAVLMASSELEELMGVADRIVVMHRGEIAGELARAEATEEKIMHLATGGSD